MTEGYLESRGIAYRINEFRDGRPTLVFIHGLSGSASAWWKCEEALAGEYNLLTYDLRGHGLSKKYARYGDYDLQCFANDLSALIGELDITRCSLVAHSMGTTVALLFLLRHSGIVTSALFLAPDYRVRALPRSRVTKPFVGLAALILRPLPFTLKTGHRLDYTRFGYSPDWSAKRIIPEIKGMGVRLYLYCLHHMYAFTHDDWWKKINIPTLIVHGTRDTFVPYRHSVRLAQEIPNARLTALQGANHMLVLNNSSDIVGAIKKFIK